MSAWLAPILGVVVIGVIVELVTPESRMGKFVRAVYAFFVLLVIVQPLPKLLSGWQLWEQEATTMVNTDLVADLTQSTRQAQVQQTLRQLGYPEALVSVQGDNVYITLDREVTAAERSRILAQIDGEGVWLI